MPPRARIDRLAQELADGPGIVEIVGAEGGFAALLLAELRRRTGRPAVVVAPDDGRARELADGLGFFEPRSGDVDPVLLFGALDHTPMAGMSPSRLHVMDRVATLTRAVHADSLAAIVVAAPALLDRVMPRAMLREQVVRLRVGATIDREQLLGFLVASGYHRVPSVEDPGTFAVRGGLIDVFPPTRDAPVRIDLWGDEIDTLRDFDPTTQRTEPRDLGELVLGPCREIIWTPRTIGCAREKVAALADRLNVPSSRVRALLEDISNGHLGVGMEDLLPAFYEELDTFYQIAPRDALWFVDQPDRVAAALDERWEELARCGEQAAAKPGHLAYSPEHLYLDAEAARSALAERVRARLVPFAMHDDQHPLSMRFEVSDNADVRREIEQATRDGSDESLSVLTKRISAWRDRGWPVVACAHSEGGAQRLAGLLGRYGLSIEQHRGRLDLERLEALAGSPHHLELFIGDPGSGFRSPELGLVLLDESEVLGRKRARGRQHRFRVSSEQALASWRDLAEGDVVVHIHHGIARYLGLEKTAVDGIEADFLVLEYAGGDKVFVPVERLHLVGKYISGNEDASPRLDKLGGVRWAKAQKRVRRAVRDLADKLLKLYAEREAREGFAFSRPGSYFASFEAQFAFEETPDQARTIEEVLADMQRQRPMDRLVCGDVGFGKTEVAMRAAFKAVLDGKQVAILVPTVVLAEQHRLTLFERFAGFPVEIAALTRLHSTAQARKIRERLREGRLDIVVGTHRVLSKDIAFRDLGLVVVDEEHRFGVAHKERLKELRATVDVLTLTATPIPRTLHLSLIGLRDVSLIRTPPADRLAVRTLVARPTEQVVSEAIRRELQRGGQVFYVHNRVQDIEEQAELVRRLVPEARVAVGHGQMRKGRLEDVMTRFVRGDSNVLVCTTIIESGLDIPNANTLLVNRADRFGLAQLYQLRGRVGRSSQRAWCYLLIPSPAALRGEAAQRIATIQRFTSLGSGFSIASYDLDIRGAGNILGADQSGHIDAVGYDAYTEMLAEAIADVRAGDEPAPPPPADPELAVAVEARIPDAYLPDTTLRLRLYKNLAGARTLDELYSVKRDAVDRYGRPDERVDNLVELMAVRIEARQLGILKVGFNAERLSLVLGDTCPIAPAALARFVTERADQGWRLSADMRLTRELDADEWARGLPVLGEALRELRRIGLTNGCG